MEFSNPLQRVFNEIAANVVTLRAIEIDGLAPRSSVRIGKIRSKIRQIVSLRAQMVVYDVEHYGHPLSMASVYKSLEGRGASVGVLHCEGIDAVIAPIAPSRKLRYGHELDCRDSQIPQLTNSGND